MDNNESIENEVVVETPTDEIIWKDEIKSKLIEIYPILEGKDGYMEMFINFAESKLQSLQNDIRDRDDYSNFEKNWMFMASRELLQREQETGLMFNINYSENGYKVEFDDSYLSKGLTRMIFPKVKV